MCSFLKERMAKKKVRVIAVNIVGILWDIIMCVYDPNAVILATI